MVEITQEGFIDFSGKRGGVDVGVRYYLDKDADSQKPVNLVVLSEGVALVIDNYKNLVFVENRDPKSGALVARYDFTVKDFSIFSDNYGDVMDMFIKEWKEVDRAEKIEQKVQAISFIKKNGKDLFVLDTYTEYDYEEISGAGSAELMFMGIPSTTTTYDIVPLRSGAIFDENGIIKEAIRDINNQSVLERVD